MQRPTRAQIRTWLDSVGLTGVDPNLWFRSVLPEGIGASADFGRLSQRLDRSINVFRGLVTPNIAGDTTFSLETVNDGEIGIVSRFYMSFGSANCDVFRMNIADTVVTSTIFRDAGGPFPAGDFIGTDNQRTIAFHSLSLDRIRLLSPEAYRLGGLRDTLSITLNSVGVAVKVLNINYRLDTYRIEDFPGW